jgi:hypothetical protein
MFRRLSTLTLGAALLVFAAGCRSTCNNQPGCFASGSGTPAPCHLTSNPRETCFDAVTGMPIPCPPQGGTTVIPGGSYPYNPGTIPGSQPNELPFPSPSDMIPRQGVPFAPPSVAPGGGTGLNTKNGQTVKTGSNQ